jgi:hypothetical protein
MNSGTLVDLNITWPNVPRCAQFKNCRIPTRENWNVVPLPKTVVKVGIEQGEKLAGGGGKRYRKLLGRKCAAPDTKTFKEAAAKQYCTRAFAKKLIEGYALDTLDNEAVKNWIDIVKNDTIYWDQIELIEKVERPEVTYDFSVPGKEAFAIDGTHLTHNTMNYHVPVSDSAVQEAINKMMPSKQLFAANSFDVHYLPRQEYLHGLYLASKQDDNGKKLPRVFATTKDVLAAYRRGEISANDPVIVKDQ